jgi:hypothetical protein
MSTLFFVPGYKPHELKEYYMEERRSGRRHFVEWPVRIETIDEASIALRSSGTLCDISSSGAFVNLIGHIPIGRRLKVSIKLPLGNEVWMSYTAQVVRFERGSSGTGIALRFDNKRPFFSPVKQENT